MGTMWIMWLNWTKSAFLRKSFQGTTQITKSPDRLLIAELTAKFCDAVGIVKDGFSFQAGAGGYSSFYWHLFPGDHKRKRY